ncbi:DUF4430 domain-containing protein [Tepidibacter hydrothermalis]|uniref:DUF4430 domain-containing protein n=1 Tax=Tepidibacter hydrothermalis TaxID=3036126 RepID=A0ABY8ED51_9FIRM|nr:DUF4430 domain-containing protein [Tepidibacter hydrothermalis]WFD10711.1 DUF4430 domain-containing protein [Tepidibacter hydrothermalis]
MRKIFLFFISIILTFSLIGCSDKNVSQNEKVNLIVSKGFGNVQVYNEELGFEKDSSVIEIMEENLELKLEKGFTNSINGLKAESNNKKKLGWFYYVNGNLAQVGPKDYYINPEDSIIWDLHDWGNEIYISSIIGAYPNNFTKGYEGNVLKGEIRYSKEFKEDSENIAKFLKSEGLQELDQRELDDKDIKNEKINTVVIGDWDEVSKIDYINDIYNNEKGEIFFEIDEDYIKALDYDKKVSKEYKKGAVITSIPKGYGTGSNLWIVTGNDENSIENAAKLLYEEPEKIKGKFSVVVSGNEVLNIPVEK